MQAITNTKALLVQNVYQLIEGSDGPEKASVRRVLVLPVIVALSSSFRGDSRISAEPFERVLARMEQG